MDNWSHCALLAELLTCDHNKWQSKSITRRSHYGIQPFNKSQIKKL